MLALFCLAAAGTPGLNSFIGEFLIIGGAFQTRAWLGAMTVWGVVLGTTYMIWLYYRVVMGKPNPELAGHKLELKAREVATLAPLAVLALWLGIYPELILSYIRAPVAKLLAAAATP
jgi:NADH-quinone oxidoreductase subunit M